MKAHEKLLASWRAEHPPYDRVLTHGDAEVAALEVRYGVHLPPDFRDYLLNACSTADDGGLMDDQNSAWWGLDRLRSVSEEYEYPLTDDELVPERDTAIFFADHMSWAMAWAICCRAGPNYGRIFVCSDVDRFVADSFSIFVEQYLADHRYLI